MLRGGAAEITLPIPDYRQDPDRPDGLAHLRRPCGCARFGLTDREVAVLEQLAEGKSSQAAARSLYVSHQAITYHVGNLLAKFQCTSRTGLVSRAFVLGILAPTWPPTISGQPPGRQVGSFTKTCWHGVKDLNRRRTSA